MSLIEDKTALSSYSQETLNDLVERSTLTVFQTLNKKLNEEGLCILIQALEERTNNG